MSFFFLVSRTYVLSFSFLFISSFHGGAQAATTITFTNNCSYKLWPAGTSAITQNPHLSTTGFELPSGASTTVDIGSPWNGRFWARTGCSTNSGGNFTCATGECGTGKVECNGTTGAPPATLIELSVAANDGQDFYDVSNVDGFNIPVSIAPEGGGGNDESTCKASICPANINLVCPADLQVRDSAGGNVIACKSRCSTGTCGPTNNSRIFREQCPDAYSYPTDDFSTFTCSGGHNYVITFCPLQQPPPFLMCVFHGSS